MTARTRPCDEATIAGRLRKAEQFLDAAETIREFAEPLRRRIGVAGGSSPGAGGLGGERTVLGGRLPGGAVGAGVVTDSGDRVAGEVGDRARKRVASRAVVGIREIAVDDAPVAFACVRSGSRWAAVAYIDSLIITVMGAEVDPGAVRLRSVPDPAKTLL